MDLDKAFDAVICGGKIQNGENIELSVDQRADDQGGDPHDRLPAPALQGLQVREAAKKVIFFTGPATKALLYPHPPLEPSGHWNFFLAKNKLKKVLFFLVARPLPPPPS